MKQVQLPRNVVSGARCHPVKLDIVLNRDLMSTAKMVIPEAEAVNFPIHSFVELYNQNGSVGVFRVISAIKTIGESVRLEMAHAIDTLSDSLAPVDEDFSGTIAEMLTKILSYQTTQLNGVNCWQLGTVEDTATYEASINYTNLYDLLEDLTRQEIDYQCAFDFSTSPWTINFVARPTAVRSEFRLGRNIAECVITRDDTELCTRLFLSYTIEGTDGDTTEVKTYDADTLGTWGIIQKTDSCTVSSVAEADRYAARYITEHKNPTTTIAIDGADLNRITGSTFDEHDIGTMCRVALVDYGEIHQEHIVTVEYPDALNDPSRIKVTLANTIRSGAQTIAGNAKANAINSEQIRSTSSTARNALIDIRQTDYMLYQAGIAYDAETGVFMFAQADGILGHALSFVDVTKTGGRAMFTDEFERDASGKLIVKSASGMAYRKNNVEVGLFDNDNLTAGVLVQRINGTTQTTIRADKIDLQGVVSAQVFTAKVAEIVSGWSDDFACKTFSSDTVITGVVDADEINGVTGPQAINISVNGTVKATVLGTGSDVNFDRAAAEAEGAAAVVVTVEKDANWTVVDSSTGNYTRKIRALKDGVTAEEETISAQQIWNLGWNAARAWSAERGHKMISGHTNIGTMTLYSYNDVTGRYYSQGNHYWRYGGSEQTYYELPASK